MTDTTHSAEKNTCAASGAPKASPLAKRAAAVAGVDISTCTGSGHGGKIMRSDVERAAQRAAEAASLTAASLMAKVDMTELGRLCEKLNAAGGGASPISTGELVLKAAAKALAGTPCFRRWPAGAKAAGLDRVDVRMTGSADGRRLTPVVTDADRRGLHEISSILREASAGERGACFAVCDLGGYNVESFAPELCPPEAGALGVGRPEDELSLEDGAVTCRRAAHICLTFDRGLNSDTAAAALLDRISAYIEDPLTILL